MTMQVNVTTRVNSQSIRREVHNGRDHLILPSYQSFSDRWKGALSLLRGLDKHGCATALIPPDPTAAPAFAGIWVGKGGCMCNGGR
uniref:DUF7370 family protein n=1 Tax=Atlantibacter hermannii TaxID=565 RepID=UPI0028A0FB26|nr:hypothetical protein [Atlantibacter hermannii]